MKINNTKKVNLFELFLCSQVNDTEMSKEFAFLEFFIGCKVINTSALCLKSHSSGYIENMIKLSKSYFSAQRSKSIMKHKQVFTEIRKICYFTLLLN